MYFMQQSAIVTKNFLTIHNINRFFQTTVRRRDNETDPIIGISHLPLITIPGDFVKQVKHAFFCMLTNSSYYFYFSGFTPSSTAHSFHCPRTQSDDHPRKLWWQISWQRRTYSDTCEQQRHLHTSNHVRPSARISSSNLFISDGNRWNWLRFRRNWWENCNTMFIFSHLTVYRKNSSTVHSTVDSLQIRSAEVFRILKFHFFCLVFVYYILFKTTLW